MMMKKGKDVPTFLRLQRRMRKQKLFDFFNNYGRNGIVINVGPHFEDLYK